MSQIQSITLTPSTITLKEGDYYHLGTTIVPNNASVDLVWSSSNEYVCDVRSGVVYARHQGTSTISVYSNDAGRVGDTCVVTVEPAEIVPITQLVMNKTELFLPCGNSETIWATIYPSNASNRTLNWTSSNEYVAGVKNGVVTARHQGVCTITAVATDGTRVSTTCAVTVTSGNDRVEHITITPNNPTVSKNRTLQLTATVSPAEAVNKTVRWSSQDPDIASVDAASGLVSGHTEGTTTITAQAIDGSGVTASCVITVAFVPVTSITLDKPAVVLNPGANVCLIATVHPENATNQNVTWHSMDESVAKVVNGVVQARSIGRTTVYARANDSTESRGFCDVRVVPTSFIPVSSVEVTPSELVMILGDESVQLQATVSPRNATTPQLEWSSDNEAVVSVTPNTGIVSIVGVGTAIVTARATDGTSAHGSCTVAVKQDEVIICRDSDYEFEGFDIDCTYNKVVFTRTGKVWHCIGEDMVFNQTNAVDSILIDRSNYNFYANYHIDKEDNTIISTYTDDELRLLYVIDPYGVAEYIQRYASRNNDLNKTFEDKEYFFEMLFKRKPKRYERTWDGKSWFESTTNNPNIVISEAELLFGIHDVRDLGDFVQLTELIDDIIRFAWEYILGDLIIVALNNHPVVKVTAEIFFFAIAFGEAAYKQELGTFISRTMIETYFDADPLKWTDALLSISDIIHSFQDVLELGIYDKPVLKQTLKYCYSSSPYEVYIERADNGLRSLRNIHEMILNITE